MHVNMIKKTTKYMHKKIINGLLTKKKISEILRCICIINIINYVYSMDV